MFAVAFFVMGTAALLAPLLSRALGRNAGYPLAAAFLTALALVLADSRKALAGAASAELPWIPSADIAVRLRMDGLGLLFATLVLGVGALIMAYAARYLSPDHGHARLYTLLTVFATAMLGLVLADDIVLLYVSWELTTLCSFLLIGGTGRGWREATRALVVTAAGGLALLAAVVLLVTTTGSTSVATIVDRSDTVLQSPAAGWIGALVVVAAFTKSAQVPFHFWLPDAMVAVTPVSAYLHAATLVKGGIYLLMRFSPVFSETTAWTVALVGVGLTSALVGAVLALRQHDLKSLLAYSTVSQLGWIIALIGVGTTAGLAVAALHTFAHALFKATLFMLVGIIDREAGSRDIRELAGLRHVMPVTATLTGLAALSMAGIPPFLGFVAKEEAYEAFLGLPGRPLAGGVVAMAAVVAAALTFAYGIRLFWGAFSGSVRQRDLYDPSWTFLLPAAVPAVAGLGLGLGVGALTPVINSTVVDTLGQVGDADLALWHGFTPALGLSALTIAAGSALFLARARVDAGLRRLRAPLTGAQAYDGAYEGLLAVGRAVAAPARSSGTAAHLVFPIAVIVVVGAVASAVLGLPAPVAADISRPEDYVLVGATALGVIGLCVSRSRLAAVAMLGVVGFVVGLWFLVLGGPDLAVTQLLVEILTVVVVVAVLRRLPRTFASTGRRRTAAAGTLAVAAGAVAFLVTLALTGRREVSPVGQFLLARGPELSGGDNVVNTVLVDFRGFDTLGEAAVLVAAAIGTLSLGARRPSPPAAPVEATAGSIVLRATAGIVGPLAAVLSVVLLYRGHDEPGGGFIAALVAGAGVAVTRLSGAAHGRFPRLRATPLLAAGLVVGVGSGLLGLLAGSFLRPLRGSVAVGPFTQSLTTSLVFDVGVYLCVLGLVVAALDGLERRAEVTT